MASKLKNGDLPEKKPKRELSRAKYLMRRRKIRRVILASLSAVALGLVVAVIVIFAPKKITHPEESYVRSLYSYQTVTKYLGIDQFKPWLGMRDVTKVSAVTPEPLPEDTDVTPIPVVNDNEDITTFVVFGLDDGNGNTDVIMICSLDLRDYTLNIVNVPRDTLVNISGSNRKANAMYYNVRNESDVNRAKRVLGRDLKNLIGFEPDFYLTVNMSAFKKLVNAVGGIQFDVPVNMYYNDPAQNLYISIPKGLQTLNGEDALKVVRFRNTYSEGDIRRIRVQQDFLMAAAAQILAKKSEIPITTIVDIFVNNVTSASHITDYEELSMNYYTWIASELLKLDAENITFTTLPGNTVDSVKGTGYVTIYVDQWLEIIRDKLHHDVAESQLGLLTRNSSGYLYVTNGNWVGSAWSSYSSGSGSGGSTSTPTPNSSTPAPTTSVPSAQTPSVSTDTPGAVTAPSETADPSAQPTDVSPTPDTGGQPSEDVTTPPIQETEQPGTEPSVTVPADTEITAMPTENTNTPEQTDAPVVTPDDTGNTAPVDSGAAQPGASAAVPENDDSGLGGLVYDGFNT